ncbi:uncharacterized protein LOC134194186 isoform X2 [Corticium candelabrum]|uniref:uncharacterized protein LOC134194186 isoform X2 n=1 Tax=Corticium candelabrum TaxID=121492 RepID=UPI002E26EC7C|nr:uncharacterized protein LOC134194186 isoform X2 [Corticium candelabrum]
MSSCFLCSTPNDTTTLWTKRKRLDGRSLTDARHTLEVMLQEHSGLPLSSYVPPAGPAYVCHYCQNDLKKLSELHLLKIKQHLAHLPVYVCGTALKRQRLEVPGDKDGDEMTGSQPEMLQQRIQKVSPKVKVVVKYKSGMRAYNLASPRRKQAVKRCVRGNLFSVFSCLQPLMVCISHKGTFKMLDRISDNFDSEVKSWSENLKHHFPTEMRIIGVAKSSELAQSSSSSNQSEYRLDTDNQTDHCTENQTVDKTVSTDSELKN